MSNFLAGTAVVIGFIAAMVALFGLLCLPIYYSDKASCYAFGRESNREVRFVKFHIADWDCLTPSDTDKGKWISTSRLRENDSDE